ncbi:hypothetical protein MtrunA17_Chr4g0075641 [Medicago truncatula]|uniref:Uncharacterized protein n=1 Tax=Medicago truncatula TaxID=3880 RepID=A0A396IIQ2_MEDTR|nr:hypothetical protein MtrunA17_Chr4g0075641 [Medicago truncatula]
MNDKIQAVINAGVCGRLVELLLHPSPSVLFPALRAVACIVTGDDMHNQESILFLEGVGEFCFGKNEKLYLLITMNLVSSHCLYYVISCATCENNLILWDSFCQAIINHGSLPCILSLLTNNHTNIIKKEACRTISCITAGHREQIQAI